MKKIPITACVLFLTWTTLAQKIPNINSQKHSSACFTQGLIIQNNTVWESCGGYGKSQLKKWDLKTSKVIKRTRFDKKYFIEGLTEFNGDLFLLTWHAGLAFRIDSDTLETIEQFHYQGQGWGLTHNDTHLIASNGSDSLQFIDPKTFKMSHRIQVNIDGVGINNLNELEWINGKIWANVFETDYILVINPESGAVEDKFYLPHLLNKSGKKPGVLNGIAFDSETQNIWLTGKNWPLIFKM